MITPIEKLTPINGEQKTQTLADTKTGDMFQEIFRSAIDNVKVTDAEKVETQYLLSTGQLDNPAVMGIASTKAELAVSLLVQLRNKALDAYSELTRMNL